MNRKLAAVLALTMALVLSSSLCIAQSGGEGEEDLLLIDHGNGTTDWMPIGEGTYLRILSSAGASVDGGVISVDGLESRTTGNVTAEWRLFSWDGSWTDITDSVDLSSEHPGGALALGFYPEGMAPTETPDHRSSWTMIRGDSSNSGSQDAELSDSEGSVEWEYTYGDSNYVNATVLVEGDRAYVVAGGGYTSSMPDPKLYCYDRITGELLWSFEYPKGAGYETATGIVLNGYVYLPATNGTIYRIPTSGPGEDVVSLDIDKERDHTLTGTTYSTGAASLVYDSGVIYFGTSNGYVYCVDADLDVIWRTQVGGSIYYSSVTVVGEHIVAGALDGHLYVFDRYTGEISDSTEVYTLTKTVNGNQRTYGSANVPVMTGGVLMLSYSDGQGMNSSKGGIAAYRLEDGVLTELFKIDTGLTSTYVLPVESDGFAGVYFTTFDGLNRASVEGEVENLSGYLGSFKSPLTLVNDEYVIAPQYDKGSYVYIFDLEGGILGQIRQPELVQNYVMCPVTVIDGMFYMGTDAGVFSYSGSFISASDPGDPVDEGGFSVSGWTVAGIAALIIIVLVVAWLLNLRRNSDIPLMAQLRQKAKESSGFNNDRTSKVRRNKRRLLIVILIGVALALIMFSLTLMVGPSGNYGLAESFSILLDSIGKSISGEQLVGDEIIIFDSRCSRAVAAFVVGIGLSVAGAVYQAIIRNPMVDPYIMGVSAGAGVAAVATIAFDFTFFGLLGDTTFATPIVAMIGGLIAFGCTMLLAEKAGGSSINYVLAGVIVGLVFSALQTLMLSMAGNKLNDAMSWLFGSFASIDWTETLIIVFPIIAMSLVPLVWAKEFNLVLLGEDQARQMGLDVRKFNRWMLILASVLASVCVAFVGIIGFVGLVVPHLCRMILGGDHRLVLPASMVVGGALMMAADLFAKMAMVPLELPVGAITTVIGAPVFAYLLIKKGRMYDG